MTVCFSATDDGDDYDDVDDDDYARRRRRLQHNRRRRRRLSLDFLFYRFSVEFCYFFQDFNFKSDRQTDETIRQTDVGSV